jgi:murein L,D-transpeptidase YafK
MLKNLLVYLLFIVCGLPALSQSTFLSSQSNYPILFSAFKSKEEGLKKQFEQAGLSWPAKQLYIRSFKYDSQLEVWIRNDNQASFQWFKTYKICALSGALGPKRFEGDYQVPEGFYYINELNPNSKYHLSLGINYPNLSDRTFSSSLNPGGDIYIHGTCATVGCIPIQNDQIEELYILSAFAQEQGQNFIPVHIFPVRFNQEKNTKVLNKAYSKSPDYESFVDRLKAVYSYFELNKKLPLISINSRGDYKILSR